MNNDYYTRVVHIVDFDVAVVRKEANSVTLRGKYGIEMTVDEKRMFKDARTVDVGTLHCTLADYNWWLAGAWRKHFEKTRRKFLNLYCDNVPLWVLVEDYMLDREEMRNAIVPLGIWMVEDLRIGQLMKAWNYGLTAECPHCGGTGKIYSFGGSPFSGLSTHSLYCPDCGNFSEDIKDGRFNQLRHAVLTAQRNHPATIAPYKALNFEQYITKILKDFIGNLFE